MLNQQYFLAQFPVWIKSHSVACIGWSITLAPIGLRRQSRSVQGNQLMPSVGEDQAAVTSQPNQDDLESIGRAREPLHPARSADHDAHFFALLALTHRGGGWDVAGPADTRGRLTIGVASLGAANAVAQALCTAGLEASLDVGQQGSPATVCVNLPAVHRRHLRRLALAAALAIEPNCERLKSLDRRKTSVRVSTAAAAVEALKEPNAIGRLTD